MSNKKMITIEERDIIFNYISIMENKTVADVWKSKKLKNKYHRILRVIKLKIEAYGEDGMGDKPNNMNTYAYWLQHIDENHYKRI